MSEHVEVSAVSDWHTQSGTAEVECNERLNAKILAKTKQLEDEGKSAIGNEASSIEIEEREDGGQQLFQASATAKIVWI